MTAFIPILYHTIINGIIVTRHVGDGSINSTKLANPSITAPSASSFAVTTANKTLLTAIEVCYANVYLDFTSGAFDTTISVSDAERLYFSPQRARGNSGVWLKPGDVLQVKANSAYTAGWLRVDITKF